MVKTVRTGLDNFIASPPDGIFGQRLGLLCNPASVNNHLQHARHLINSCLPGQLKVLFSPQHGFFSEKQDNMVESPHMQDPDLGIQVFSLYGETRKPTPEMFDLFDTLLIDLQDVGTRVYTFIYTVSYCLEVAQETGKKVIILDRPNPLGGHIVEGNLLKKEWSSFVGRYEIPMRHSLTMGELAQYINSHHHINADLKVVPMTGWQRQMLYTDTGLPWVLPSPNLPTPAAALVYPGQVLWEGTNVSEARGTALPFELFGAPYFDSEKILENIESRYQSGIILRKTVFEPVANKWKKQRCYGFQVHVTDPGIFTPYHLSLALLQAVRSIHPNDFQYKPPPYEYEYEKRPMDLLIGDREIRLQLEQLEPLEGLIAAWQPGLATFEKTSRPYLIYDKQCQREIR